MDINIFETFLSITIYTKTQKKIYFYISCLFIGKSHETPINIILYCSIQRDHVLKINLNTKSDQNIHQDAPNCIFFKTFLGGACPLACVQLVSLFLCENSYFSFRMLSKYKLKRIIYNMFSKTFSWGCCN